MEQKNNDNDLKSAIDKICQLLYEKEKQRQEDYPTDIPNSVCDHAFLYGLSIENSFKPVLGEYTPFFKTKHESTYIWTYRKNTNSAIVSHVDLSIKENRFWKTAGRLIRLAYQYSTGFEAISELVIDYKWMYYFDSRSTIIDDIVFYGLSEIERRCISNGLILKATDISHMASIIELFERDDRAYTAVSLVESAFLSHQCCLICELSSYPYHDHLAEEPNQWNQADFLQKLEVAIVQSCRAVECIIGEPPNSKKISKVIAFKEKWESILGFKADDIFDKVGKSYFDFYYELFFDLRNPSAHSYGNIHYDLQRKRAVEAQCFAALILKGYVDKNAISNDDALRIMCFNQELLSKVSEDLSTKMTVDNNNEKT